jgi:hypothetical protein
MKLKDNLVRLLSLIDIYGRPVRLTLNGFDTYKTPFGGMMTILSIILLGTYFLTQFVILADSKSNLRLVELEDDHLKTNLEGIHIQPHQV